MLRSREEHERKKGYNMNIRKINGTYAEAVVFLTDAPETAMDDYTVAQIKMICDNEAAKDSRIRIMPDCHPGKIGPVGLTMTVGRRILPGLVGIDIGCGVTMGKIKTKKMEFQKLDSVIRDKIPSGFSLRKNPHHYMEDFDLSRLHCYENIRKEKAALSLGTLGGGNHFIEVDKDGDGNHYLAIHSGSRHLGKEVAEYYLAKGQEKIKQRGIQVPYEMTWLEGTLMDRYLKDVQVVQEFAALNRKTMLDILCKEMKWKLQESFSCIHNYVEKGKEGCILRKGAVSAREGEPVVIPINMRDGIILGRGLGNPEWNCSSPHGAGRTLKRTEVSASYTVSAFKKEMKGIYSSCISKETLDESPFAYRGMEIQEAVRETVQEEALLKPLYNYKAGSNR